MRLLLNIILLPFLPLRLAWKWSTGAKINGQVNGFAHVLATIIVSSIFYGLIGKAFSTLITMFNK